MIRHTQQLCKENMGMIASDLTIIHFIGEKQAALVVVRSGYYSDAIDIFQTKQYRLIIVYIRSFFMVLYGVAISFFFGPFALNLHVGTPHQFSTKVKTSGLCIGKVRFEGS